MEHVDEDYLENSSVADAGLLLANKPTSIDRSREGSGRSKAPTSNVVVAFQSEHDVSSSSTSSSFSSSYDIGARNRSLMESTRARDIERAQARLNKGDLVEIERLLEVEDMAGGGGEEVEVEEKYDISGDHWPLETGGGGNGGGDSINRSVTSLKSTKPRKNIGDSSSGNLPSLLYMYCYYDMYWLAIHLTILSSYIHDSFHTRLLELLIINY